MRCGMLMPDSLVIGQLSVWKSTHHRGSRVYHIRTVPPPPLGAACVCLVVGAVVHVLATLVGIDCLGNGPNYMRVRGGQG